MDKKDELKEILHDIMNVYNTVKNNDSRHQMVSKLWTLYYRKSKQADIILPEAYNLYLMTENESYIIDQSPSEEEPDYEKCRYIFNKLRAIQDPKQHKEGLTEKEVHTILQFIIYNTRMYFQKLGANLSNGSLNGFCELGQILTLRFFGDLGFQVTKNQAEQCFKYPYNHAFGTVTFPVIKHGKIINQSYLIDTTYRQFFATNRCNEGRYDTVEENTGLSTAPDPGYFVKDKEFAKELLYNGYIRLDSVTAKKYGEPFYMASLKKEEAMEKKNISLNFYSNILNNGASEYKISKQEMAELDIDVLASKNL